MSGEETTVRTARHEVTVTRTAEETLYVSAKRPLGPVADRTVDWLANWAAQTPQAICVAERSGPGWRELTYAEVAQTVRALAGGLLGRGIGPGKPVMVISGNGVDHALLALAAQTIGAPIVPVAEQYALIKGAHRRLRHAIDLTNPAMIFADDGARYGEALKMEAVQSRDLIVARNPGPGQTLLSDLMTGGGDVDAALAQVGPSTVVKILLTSGSSSAPKAVPTTHKMMCTNQVQLRDALPFLGDRTPKLVDWLPWNHVFGGSHNFNMMLANGGAFYVDNGKPTEALFPLTLENLSMHTGTLTFNVPIGFELLVKAFTADDALAKRYFTDLDMIFYAGASLPQPTWEALENLALKHRGTLPLMTSSWGLTETAPASLLQQEPIRRSGVIGVPLAGQTLKLIPDGTGRYEARVKGPNIMDGYLNDPEKTAAAFDDEGYFITGDAMAFVDADDPSRGMRFDGRISDEFKLLTGTWVRASALRLELLKELDGLAEDLVITGADRDDIGVMIFPSAKALALCGATPDVQDGALADAGLQDIIARLLLARDAKGQSSSSRILRAVVLADPPSMPEGEMTAKGNLNTRAIQKRRADLLTRLYSGGAGVILVGDAAPAEASA